MNTSDPYSPDRVRAVLHGHLGLLDSIEPDEDALPCGEVIATRRDGSSLILDVRWDDGSVRAYRLTAEAAPGEEGL